MLTEIYYEQKDYQKALYYISKALKIDDYNVFYWRKYSDINIKLNLYNEGIKGLEKCLELNDCSIEIYTALSDLLMFVGDFKTAFEVLISAQDSYKNTAEIEYRLSGLSLVFDNEKEGLTHLLNGLKIDFNMHTIMKELFPSVLVNLKVKELLYNYKKAME